MNVDQLEIQKFSAQAQTWWNLDGAFKPLHQLNPLRTNWITEHAQGLFQKILLDVGCGGGILSESLAKRQAIVTGIDASQESIHAAQEHAQQNNLNITYHQTTAEDYANSGPCFDVITCMELLEHVPDFASVVQACSRLVKPGGHVFFSTLNRTLKSRLLAIGAAEYLLKMVPKGTHTFEKFIKPAELIQQCEQTNLHVKAISGVIYNPFLQRFYLNRDVSVNYMLHCEKPCDAPL